MNEAQLCKIGLVLSGGGVRGLAHVGAVKALREAGVQIDAVAGTSAGALVGVMVAADCSVDEMLTFWTETNAFGFQRLAGTVSGLFDPKSYIPDLTKFIPYECFEELPKQLTVAVTAMVKGEVEYVSSGPLWPMVLASATFPIVFTPIEVDGELYMDGGIVDNLPAGAIREHCEFVIGINVSPKRRVEASDLARPRDLVERMMDLRFATSRENESMLDFLVIPPFLENYAAFDTASMLEIFEHGYDAMKKALPTLKEKISESTSTRKGPP